MTALRAGASCGRPVAIAKPSSSADDSPRSRDRRSTGPNVFDRLDGGRRRARLTRCVLAVAAVCLAAAGCSAGSANHNSRPSEQANADPSHEALQDRVQAAVDEFLASRLVPGVSVAVRAGSDHAVVVAGVADIDTDRPVTAETQFRLASVTKMYVAAIVLRLVQRGKLSLDDTVGRYVTLPEGLEFAEGFRPRQLLSHTSGLAQTPVRDEDRGHPLSKIELLERMPPPACSPAECWNYGDANFVLVEMVLEARSGRSVAQLIRDELVAPLGLQHTAMVDPASADVKMPPQYAPVQAASGGPAEPRRLFQQAFPLTPTLLTTATDAATFTRALFTGDVLDPTSVAAMLDTAAMRDLPCPAGCRFDYGLGVFHFDVAEHEFVGHDGGSGAVAVHDCDNDLTVAILTNGGDQDMRALLEAVLDAVGG